MSDQHSDHDIHGPVLEVWPDGRTTLDPDCDCPPDCAACESEEDDTEDDYSEDDCPGPTPDHGCRYCRSNEELDHASVVL